MEHYRRHNIVWHILYPIVYLIARIRFHYQPKVTPIPKPCLVVSNHVTNWDPLLLALTIKNQAYFVGSDHVVQSGFVGRLLDWLQAPIARRKGVTASDTALTMIRRLRKGYNVALFPEGNRTFNGRTGAIVPSTAKLVRTSHAYLATHRFRGGYFSSPRWAGDAVHRGRMTGEIVHIYSPDELQAMSVQQIAELLERDLFEDAYASQEDNPVDYRNSRRAEHLERALYLCPKCRGLNTLHSKGTVLRCSACGLTAEYTPQGYLEGKDLPYHTVYVWDLWQTQQLQKFVDTAGPDDILAEDDAICIRRIDAQGSSTVLCENARMCITRTALSFGDISLPLAGLQPPAMIGAQIFIVSDGSSGYYRLTSKQVRCMRRYLHIYRAVTSPEHILDL